MSGSMYFLAKYPEADDVHGMQHIWMRLQPRAQADLKNKQCSGSRVLLALLEDGAVTRGLQPHLWLDGKLHRQRPAPPQFLVRLRHEVHHAKLIWANAVYVGMGCAAIWA